MTSDSEWHLSDDIPRLVNPGRHYQRAPIVEAIIEILCDLRPGVTLEDLEQTVDSTEFPNHDASISFSGKVEVTSEGITGDASGQQVGHVFRRKDGLRGLQSRFNGFAYSAYQPYDHWESFSSEALLHWNSYIKVAHPVRANRLGVRYVNRIDIPQAQIEIKDYLRTTVDVSPYLPQIVNGYFFQVIVPLSAYNAMATIASTITPPQGPDMTSLILDIDIWRGVSISLEDAEAGKQEIAAQLEMLREAKNYVFESCITDATRGLIS